MTGKVQAAEGREIGKIAIKVGLLINTRRLLVLKPQDTIRRVENEFAEVVVIFKVHRTERGYSVTGIQLYHTTYHIRINP